MFLPRKIGWLLEKLLDPGCDRLRIRICEITGFSVDNDFIQSADPSDDGRFLKMVGQGDDATLGR